MARRPTGNSWGRTHFRSPRSQTWDYQGPRPWPSQQNGQIGEWATDAVSGNSFPAVYAIQSYFGTVDGRDGSTYDIGQEEHEMTVTMRGPYIPPRYGPFSNRTFSFPQQGPLPPPDPPPTPTPGEVTTFYVSPAGSDANPGTDVLPFETLQFAHDQMVDLDSCTVMDGTYPEGMRVTTNGLTFIAESSAHVINSTDEDIIYLDTVERTALSGLKVANATRHGFHVSHSDNTLLENCEADGCGIGLFTAYSNYLHVDGGAYDNSVGQHGIYHSNHGHYPLFENLTADGNMRAGLQINADRQAADDPPDHVGPILGAIIRNCVFTGNCVELAGAQVNLFGCWGAILENVDCVDGLFGGINLSNDDNLTPSGLYYGSKNCVLDGITITGLRGLSVKRGSTNLQMDDITIDITAGPCIDYDDYSFPPMALGLTESLTTSAVGFKAFQNSSSGADYTVSEWRALPQ